jgi:hypothetical protein
MSGFVFACIEPVKVVKMSSAKKIIRFFIEYETPDIFFIDTRFLFFNGYDRALCCLCR